MIKITLKRKDGSSMEVHAYKAGESVTIFPGATGVFGAARGSKKAGLVYVERGKSHVNASDDDVDSESIWNWIQDLMQKGLDSAPQS